MKKIVIGSLAAVFVLFLLIQLVPYGRAHTNPPTRQEVQWRTAEARNLVTRACYDCHSNQTSWPWYSNIAPVSWLLQRHVEEGRQMLNFSEWDRPQEGEEAAELVRNGEMPPWNYMLLHPSSNLSGGEKDTLIQELIATLGGERGGDGEGGEDNEGEGEGDD